MQKVSFINMSEGTAEEYAFLNELEHAYVEKLPDRLIATLKKMDDTLSGYQVDRLEHSLQSATYALRANEPTAMVGAALLPSLIPT